MANKVACEPPPLPPDLPPKKKKKKRFPGAQMTCIKTQGRTIKTSEGESYGLIKLKKKLQEGPRGGSVS